MSQQTKYVNSVFIQQKEGVSRNGIAYSFQRMGVKKDEFIKELQSMPADDRGFLNFIVTKTLKDPSKYSMYVDDWKPNQTSSPPPPSSSSSSSSRSASPDPSDDLPF